MLKKILLFIEWFVIIIGTVAVLVKPAAAISVLFPFAGYTALAVALVTLMLGLAGMARSGSTHLPAVWITGISIITFFFIDLTASPQMIRSVPPLYLLVLFVAGFTAHKKGWIIPLVIFCFAAPVKAVVVPLVNQLPFSPELFYAALITDPFYYAYLLLSGGVGVILAGILRPQIIKIKPAVLPKTIEQPSATEIMVRVEKDPQLALTETMTILKPGAGGDELTGLLSSVVYFMSRNFRAFSALGFIYDPAQNAFVLNSSKTKSVTIKKDAVIPVGCGVIGTLGPEKKSFMTGDLRVYNSEITYYREDEPINSILAVAVVSEDELLGALVLDSKENQAFRDQDKENLVRFSTLAAALIKSERSRFIQEKSAKISQLFYQASHQFTTALKAGEVFSVLFSVIPEVVACSRQISVEFDGSDNTGKVLSVWGEDSDVAPGFTFPVNAGGLYAFAFQKRKSIIIGDFQQYVDRYYRFLPNEPRRQDIRSLAIFPILDDEQRCKGLFSVESSQPNAFHEDTEQVVTTLIENASVAFVRAMLYQKMEKLATTDGLTGLNNHRTFQELLAQEMERARRYSRPLSLLLMDIDHFKTFNDTYGHPVGDLVLKEIAACIRKSIRINDIPARYGGEEFVVIIPETNERGALVTAERIRSTIEQHTVVSLGRELKVTVSIGCSAFPENAPSQQALIDTADKALYAAKKGGRNRVLPYKNGM